MGFLSGRLTFQRYHVLGDGPRQFGPEHLEILAEHAIGRSESVSIEQPSVGFLAGEHLFDLKFDLAKNVINDALHFAVRIDSVQIPSAIRKAWLQMELAALTVDNPSGNPTKAQRKEAKEAVEARCQEEAQSDRFRRMQQFPVLWDAAQGVLYFGGSSASASEQCAGLFSRAFDLELDRITAGKLAQQWAEQAKRLPALDQVSPCVFHDSDLPAEIGWWNGMSGNFDYLGNEFLLWLWWRWETDSDTIALPDGSEVTGMLARTLSLECPRGETGKETISAVAPSQLPEASQAIQSGKLPRKAGLTLSRHGVQCDLALQAESFAVGGARIQAGEDEEGRAALEDRIDALRSLSGTLDLLLAAFCERRIGKNWTGELEKMRRWLSAERGAARKPAA